MHKLQIELSTQLIECPVEGCPEQIELTLVMDITAVVSDDPEVGFDVIAPLRASTEPLRVHLLAHHEGVQGE